MPGTEQDPSGGGVRTSGVVSNVLNVAGMLSGNAKAQLVAEGSGSPVVFTVNPSGVKISKDNKVEGERGVIVSGTQDAIRGSGNVRLVISDAHVMGIGVTQMAADQMIKWATPDEAQPDIMSLSGSFNAMRSSARAMATKTSGVTQSVGNRLGLTGGTGSTSYTKDTTASTEEPKTYQLPVLLFSWGLHGPRGSNIPVTLEKVTVDYKRFDQLGMPIWAQFNFTLVEVFREKAGQNPTSGGLQGRSVHIVQQGENLVQVANRVYGSPMAWRAVAETNGLDDPLRVKPGRALSLPPKR